MIPALRKSLPYLIVATVGGVAVSTWKPAAGPPARAPVATSIPTKQARSLIADPAATALGFISDPGQPWQLRIDQLRSILRSECGEPEIRYLYHLLEKPAPQGELPEHWYVIANDIMTQLMEHDTDPQRFSTNFLGLLQDTRQPLVIRDYAVQYLATWLNPLSRQATTVERPAPSPELTAQVLQSLVDATIDPASEQSTIPGTTLMMLVDLARSPGEVDCTSAITSLKPWLTHALQDGSSLSNPIRVSAVQAAGILAPLEFRPVLRRIAFTENGESSLRLPSIAALGHCGEAEDLVKLQQIIRSNPELIYAAQDASAKLSASLSIKN